MQRVGIVFALLAGLACASSGGSGGSESAAPIRREESQVTRVEARVKSIDLKKRLVTLSDDSGGEATFRADEAVKNLPQVKVGDVVEGELVEAVVIELRQATPEEAAAGITIAEAAATAEPGQKPAGLFVRELKAVLTIEAIDKQAGTVTLRGPAGNTRVVPVRDRSNLDRAKVGDTVVVTYTESLHLEVRAPEPT